MNPERLQTLIAGLLDERLSPAEQAELLAALRASAEARRCYWDAVAHDSLLQEVVRESAGRDLAQLAAADYTPEQPPLITPARTAAASAHPLPRRRASLWLSAGGLLLTLIACVLLSGYLGREAERGGAAPGAAEGPAALATLNSLAGEAWLSGGARERVKLASGQQFFVGDAVQVGDEGAAEVLLADGSQVALGASSLLRFPAAGPAGETHLHLERGSANVDAAPQPSGQALVFSTEQARLVVLGTRFRLYAAQTDSRVELEEGKVRFERTADGETVQVAAGEYVVCEAHAPAGGQPAEPLVAQSLSADWRLRHTLLRAGRRVAFSHRGAQLATADNAQVRIWDVVAGERQHALKTSAGVESLSFTPVDDELAALSEQGRFIFWKLGAPAAKEQLLACPQGDLRRCAVSPSGRWLAQTSSAETGYLPVWQVSAEGLASQVRNLPLKAGAVVLAETATGPVVVASQWGGTTIKWDALSGEELARFRCGSELHRLALSRDGRWLAGYSNADGLLLIDTQSGARNTLWPPGSVRVNGLCFSASGDSLSAALNDGVVRAWSLAEGRLLWVLATGDASVAALDLSPSGDWLATAGGDGAVKLWQRDPALDGVDSEPSLETGVSP